MNWQPIETAPKDGSTVWAVAESKHMKNFEATRFPYPLKSWWNGKAWVAGGGHKYDPQPTHWMPLPPPPLGDE